MKSLFFVPFAATFFALACTAFASRDRVRQSPPWQEIAVYSVDEKSGTLLKSRAWTPESPDYLAYSIRHCGKDGDSCREQFAKGFFAYERRKDPVQPFTMVRLLPPQEILDIMKTLPSGEGKGGTPTNDSERYVPLRNDSYTPYWKRFDRILGMVQSEGRVYFFPDGKEKAQRIPWDGEGRYRLEKVSNFPNHRGLLEIRARIGGNEGKTVYLNLDPVTGKSSPSLIGACCPVMGGLEEPAPFINPVRIDPETAGFKESMRWCSSFEAARSAEGGKKVEMLRQTWSDLGEDIIVTDGRVWLSRGDNAVLLYPEPWQDDSSSRVSVTLENRGSSAPGNMDFMITLKNISGKPVKLEQGWGSVILRFSGDGRFTCNSLCEARLEPFVPGWDLSTGEELPEQTLGPGESVAALIRYSCPDWRIYPRDAHVFVKATFSTFGPVETPGHGMYTSAPIRVPNPVSPSP